MFKESMESEILSPTGFLDELVAAGLVGMDITIEEFLLADRWGNVYPKLSVPDRKNIICKRGIKKADYF